MDRDQARQLGDFIKNARLAKNLSLLKLSKLTGIHDVTLGRLENGVFAEPGPDKLKRVAKALDLSLADVYAIADYALPEDLPSFSPYLRSKYRDLPDEAAEDIERYARRLAKKHGVDLTGPKPGQDELH